MAVDVSVALLLSLGCLANNFRDENNKPIATRKESIEHALIRKHVAKQSCGVLELGARYGTSSCAIARHVDRKDAVVSVEADPLIAPATERNLRENNCSSHLIHGVVARQPMVRSKRRNGSGYTTYFEAQDANATHSAGLANNTAVAYTPAELEQEHQVHFDAMVVDCEGCFEAFVSSFPTFVARMQTIILEADYGLGMQSLGYVNYTVLEQSLHGMGFATVERFNHPCCRVPPWRQIQMMVFRQDAHSPRRCA